MSMTDEAVNRAIAKFLGLGCYHQSNNGDENMDSDIIVHGKHVPRYELFCVRCGDVLDPENYNPVNYAGSLDAAMLAVEKMVEQGYEITMGNEDDGTWYANLVLEGSDVPRKFYSVTEPRLAKAICLASLKAGRAE